MRPAVVRLALAAAGVSTLGFALTAHAAPAPGPKTLVITDGSGDAKLKGDIVKITYTTTGTKTKTSYTPKNLVVTIETADAIDTSGTTTYEVDADLAGCELGFNLYYTPGVEGSEGSGCGNGSLTGDSSFVGVDGPPTVGAKTITFTIPLKAVPGVLKPGVQFTSIHGYTAAVDPITGFVGPYFVDDSLTNDDVTSDRGYKLG